MGKISRTGAAMGVFLWAMVGAQPLHAQEDSSGPEVWGPLWEPAWEGGWFTQASPFTLDVSLGRRTKSTSSRASGVPAARAQTGADVYAVARLSLPWETFLPQARVQLPVSQVPTPDPLRDERVVEEHFLEKAGAEKVSTSDAPGEQVSSDADVSSGLELAGRATEDSDAGAEEPASDSRSALLVLLRAVVERVKNAPAQMTANARLASLISRSRTSGLVPELRLRGVYGFDQTTSLEDTAGLYPGDTTTRGGHDSLLEARLTFRLDRLVLGDSETTLERQRSQLVEQEQKRIALALTHLLKWKTAVLRAKDPSLLPDEQLEAIVEEESALAHLHLLTGGWFRGWPTVKSLGLESLFLPTASQVVEEKPSEGRDDEADSSFNEVEEERLFAPRN